MESDLSLSGYASIDAIRKAIEADDDWDTAETDDKFLFYILRAAQNVDRFAPFTEEESKLNSYLASRMAGKRLCDFAWRMFAQSEHPTSF